MIYNGRKFKQPFWLLREKLRIPVLTYHPINVIENHYAANDHMALASDLETIHELGFQVVPLAKVVDWHQGLLDDIEVKRAVAITLDDGSWFDYYDLEHPSCGMQRSMFNILRDFNRQHRPEQPAHATSFVISSPDARSSLDKSCMIGKDWWGDQWWRQAFESGLMAIESHSWDHVHTELERVVQQDQLKGDFRQVRTLADCEVQFEQSADYIAQVLGGPRPTLFAYPYGSASEFVLQDYLPGYQSQHQYRAAFTTEAKAVTKADSVWSLPRYVFGHDWRTPEGLEDILLQRQNAPMA